MLTTRVSKSRLALTITLIPLLLLLNSCAVFFNGLNQGIPVSTEPVGVEVYLDGEFMGVTPLTIQASRGQTHELLLRFGNQEKLLLLEQEISAAGVVGLAVDASSLIIVVLSFAGYFSCNGDSYCEESTLLLGGISGIRSATGLIVDVATGAIYKLNPGEVFEVFEVTQP